ncbi:MAG: hypothetical protein PGN08_14245 [Sphingomonas taxi]
MPDAKKLARIHRVRTLQLGLTRAEEVRAHEKFASETHLARRIQALADAVSPTPDTVASGVAFGAQAHFRDPAAPILRRRADPRPVGRDVRQPGRRSHPLRQARPERDRETARPRPAAPRW